MSKRPHDRDDGSRTIKRRKGDQKKQPQLTDDITSARHLQQLLTFRQDDSQALRDGIASFKTFLEHILYHNEPDDRGRCLSILTEFLSSQEPDSDGPFLAHLWQAWSFAAQEPNDGLLSAVAAILALLLKTLSSVLEFKNYGLRLCKTVLLEPHLRLIKKSLAAPLHKEHLISPCLRLLTEVLLFDGGVLARQLYKRRDETFEIGILKRNLGAVKTDTSSEDLHRRPAIRTLTARYILGYLRHLQEGGLVDILKNRYLCTALFAHLLEDPPDLVMEILYVTEQHVLKNDNLPRPAKAAILALPNLLNVTELVTRATLQDANTDKALAWLKAVVTTPSYGILKRAGWYPFDTMKDETERLSEIQVDIGLDGLDFYDSDQPYEIRNTVLFGWIKSLRPQTHERERDLLLMCFTAAPELVAPYFARSNIELEPKLSNTWVGYLSLLFEVISFPTPDKFGNDRLLLLPPQTRIMIENVLPHILTKKALVRCLNQSSNLITYFVVRVLIVAFQKLADIRRHLAEGIAASSHYQTLWHEASERLTARFVERIPKMKDVVTAFRRVRSDDEYVLQREAFARLLQLYYEVTPIEALEDRFDVSTTLTEALTRCQATQESTEVFNMQNLELEHLLQVAQQSPGMRWFTKQGSLQYSPVTTMLRLHSKSPRSGAIRTMLGAILEEADIICGDDALNALIASFVDLWNSESASTWAFIDDCLIRVSHKPVKYLDDVEVLARDLGDLSDVSTTVQNYHLIIAVMLEQAHFVPLKEDSKMLIRWIEDFLVLLATADAQHSKAIFAARSRISKILKWSGPKFSSSQLKARLDTVQLSNNNRNLPAQVSPSLLIDDQAPFEDLIPEPKDHPELLKWSKKDLDEAFEEGHIGALILCLCSQYQDVRMQALVQLNKLVNLLQNSNLDDKDSLFTLIGELIETYEQNYVSPTEPMPYLTGTFAKRAILVQKDPTHFMYTKLNKYLNKLPVWRVSQMPIYWLDTTVLSKPSEDDTYWDEVRWVLDWLVDGLRTAADLDILRRTGVLERIMNLYASPAAAIHRDARERVMELLWRCTNVPGGSTTLTTRTGVLSWLDMVSRGHDVVCSALRKKIMGTCDRTKIEEWSGLKLDELK